MQTFVMLFLVPVLFGIGFFIVKAFYKLREGDIKERRHHINLPNGQYIMVIGDRKIDHIRKCQFARHYQMPEKNTNHYLN